MKYYFLIIINLLIANNIFSEDKTHQEALNYLRTFLKNHEAREEFAAKNPRAAEAEALLKSFPKNSQSQMEDIVIKIISHHGSDAKKFETAFKTKGPEAAYDLFSEEIREDIKKVIDELNKNPQALEHILKNPLRKNSLEENK